MCPPNSCAELQEFAGARGDVYRFLSGAFITPPSAELIERICQPEFADDLAAFFSPETIKPLVGLSATRQSAADLQQTLHSEFMQLIKVPAGRYVTPYESVYRDQRKIDGKPVKGLLMGVSALSAKRFYRLGAMEISQDFQDLPDHVGLELHFLCRLCTKEQEFATAGDDRKAARAREMERDFLAAHVTQWLGMLRDKIHENANHPYYPAVADMAVEFTERDLATLEKVIGPANPERLTCKDEA